MSMYTDGKNRNKPVKMRKGDSEESPVNRDDYISQRKLTQEEKLFDAWEQGIEVSQLNAITDFGIGHLSSVISKMIHTEGIRGIMKYDRKSESGAKYMAYSMPLDAIPEARRQYRRYRMGKHRKGEKHREHGTD